jgi:hypothetical protein
MPRRARATIQELREAVQSLPHATRVAMLAGLDAGPIIAGAYTSDDGICPMLAAHRAGGRCSAAFFADAWDRFALRDEPGRGRSRRRRRAARRVNERELRILRVHLEASLLDEELAEATLAGALHEHPELMARRPAEPRYRTGSAWSRLFRRYDEYEAALVDLQAATDGGAPSDPRSDLAEAVDV